MPQSNIPILWTQINVVNTNELFLNLNSSLPKKSSIRNESVLQKYLNDNHLTEKKPNNVSIQSDSALKYQIITQKSKTTEQKPSKIPVKDNPSVISKPPLRPQIPKSLSSNIKSPVNKIIPDKKQDAKDKHVQISKKEWGHIFVDDFSEISDF